MTREELDQFFQGRKKILDVGCGSSKRAGAFGIDRNPAEKSADLILDVEKELLPFPDDYFEMIWTNQFLEHCLNIYFLFDELWRVSRQGAEFHIVVPYYTAIHNSQDPTHRRSFSEATFDPNNSYFNAKTCKHPYWNEVTGKPFVCCWRTKEISYGGLKQPWIGKKPEEIEFARRHHWNVFGDLKVVLVADKT